MKAIRILLLLLVPMQIMGQSTDQSSRKWYYPDYTKLHYAGEIGFISIGAGKEFFRKKNGEADIFVGYLPEGIGGDNIVTIAFKFHYLPWKKKIFSNKYELEPLTVGAIGYHALGEDLNRLSDKKLYPDGYYWWTVGFRFGPFIGSRISTDFEHGPFKNLWLYYELGTNDLFIYSWGANRTLIPLRSIFNFSFGLKASFK